jgi:hypothetical protein
MGVPEDVVECFVQMDDDELSFLAIPHYFRNLLTLSPATDNKR